MISSEWDSSVMWGNIYQCIREAKGIDQSSPVLNVNYKETSKEAILATLRLPLLKEDVKHPRWDSYLETGLDSFSAEEREGVELYREEILEEGDLTAYEADLTVNELGYTTSDLLNVAKKVSDSLAVTSETCPFLSGMNYPSDISGADYWF